MPESDGTIHTAFSTISDVRADSSEEIDRSFVGFADPQRRGALRYETTTVRPGDRFETARTLLKVA